MRYGSGFCAAAAAAAPCQFNYKRFEVVGEGEDLRLEKLSRFIRAAFEFGIYRTHSRPYRPLAASSPSSLIRLKPALTPVVVEGIM